MKKSPIVLIPSQNPPTTYLNALDIVGLDYHLEFSPKDLSLYSGLLLVGGGDVAPCFYNGNCETHNVNVIRDVNEFNLLKYFSSQNVPILGICRGLQIINVFYGGSLKNVWHHQSAEKLDIYHRVFALNGTFKNLNIVNSNHRQCVDRLCPLATDLLRSEDEIIEGFCVNNTLAVQFHPERMDDGAIKAVYGKFSRLVKDYFARLR